MTPTVVIVRVVGKPQYEPGAKRWLESYLRYRPRILHRLVVIERYADGDDTFKPFATETVRYDGSGWDCGAWQFAARNLNADLLVCFNSTCVIMGENWLERFVDAVDIYGPGLYGPMASLEVTPHIRTPCMVFTPEVMLAYPGQVLTREDTYRFESFGFDGIPNVSLWTRAQGKPVKMVTWSGCYDLADCRTPPNVFRSGDQSDLIVRDKHAEAYASSDTAGKAYLEQLTKPK